MPDYRRTSASEVTTQAAFIYVSSQPALDELVAALPNTASLGLDCEADSLHHYREKLCLLQLSFRGRNYIVDPLAGIDLTPLLSTLATKELILHDAGYDLRLLLRYSGFQHRGDLFDTMLAAQLLGFKQFGLAAVVERICGVSLSKGAQKADWSRRPLSGRLQQYACNDTRYLNALADRLRADLHARGRLEWHRESCRHLVQTATEAVPNSPPGDWRRLKGLGRMSGRERVFARELWRWRDRAARTRDLPHFKILGDKVLTELAAWAARQGAPFDPLPRLPRNIKGRNQTDIQAALKLAASTKEEKWPRRQPRKDRLKLPANYVSLTEALRSECSRLAIKLELDPTVIASRARLEAIIRTRPLSLDAIMAAGPLLRWQAELLEPCIRRVLGK